MFPSLAWRFAPVLLFLPVCLLSAVGCGTTTWSDTSRTATEQLLLSTAIDDAVRHIDFSALSGQSVYLDTVYLEDTEDREYLVGCLSERLRSQGCTLQEKPADATYIVEARAGAIGTDRYDALVGLPGTKFVVPAGAHKLKSVSLPEVALARRTKQSGIAKIACFAYHRETGRAFWQSGTVPARVSKKEMYVAGIDWFARGPRRQRSQGTSDAWQAGKEVKR